MVAQKYEEGCVQSINTTLSTGHTRQTDDDHDSDDDDDDDDAVNIDHAVSRTDRRMTCDDDTGPQGRCCARICQIPIRIPIAAIRYPSKHTSTATTTIQEQEKFTGMFCACDACVRVWRTFARLAAGLREQ